MTIHSVDSFSYKHHVKKRIGTMSSANDQVKLIPLYGMAHGLPMTITKVCDEHPVYTIENFLTPDECDEVIKVGEPLLAPSTAVEGDKQFIANYRTSWTGYMTKDGVKSENPLLAAIQLRASALTWMPIGHLEALNLTRYSHTQKYEGHHDYFNGSTRAGKAGDRVMTIFVYLNDVPEDAGGATEFPRLNVRVQPKKGNAVFWMNTSFAGQVYDKTLHAGMPITKEGITKYGMNVWMRQNPFV
jgi:prolyl 4-hydroxylase